MNFYRKIRSKNTAYYGTALLIILFIVCGLLSAVTSEQFEDQMESGTYEEVPDALENVGENPDIRVLIMTDGYRQEVHPSVEVCSQSGLEVEAGEEHRDISPGESMQLSPDDDLFEKGHIRIQAKDGGEITLLSVNRACGNPSYAGILELRTTAEGIAVINELPIENYLCRVVPSEMPASYEMEALKAQAVCARSYAYRQISDYAYPEYKAHVNDSTDYQVYGNSLSQDSTDQAVEETKGQVICYRGKIVTAYYYSTSCGKTTDLEAWGTKKSEQNKYLQSVEVKDKDGDYEKDLPWYRWKAEIPADVLSNLIELNTGKDIGKLQKVEVTKTGAGGVALQICATGDKGSVKVDTENKIRRALGGDGYEIMKGDGTVVASQTLLPSAFITIQKNGDTYVIQGGGYGHGIGMSQNGANEMAKKGKNYIEILTLFFQGVSVDTWKF